MRLSDNYYRYNYKIFDRSINLCYNVIYDSIYNFSIRRKDMVNVRPYNNKQQLLFPPCIGDFIPEDDDVHIIDEVVEILDLSEYYKDIPRVGNPSYDPKMMIKVIFAGYYYKVYSSRKMWEMIMSNVRFIYLAGMQRPNFRTISDFRKDNIEKLKKTFIEILRICKELGLIELEVIAIDSKVMKANAGKGKGYTEEQLSEEMKEIEEEIKAYLERGVKEDEEEDERYGRENSGREIPEGIRKKEERVVKIKEAIKKIREEKEEGKTRKEEERVNLTDKDAKLQNNKGKIEYGYRGEVVVDGGSQIILAVDVVAEQNDQKQLIPMVEQLINNIKEAGMEKKGKKIGLLGDCGYGTVENFKEIKERGYDKLIDFYIPDKIMEQERRGKGGSNKGDMRFDKSKFKYDKVRDVYICPNGKELKKVRESYSRGVKRWIYRAEGGCRSCKYYGECTRNKSGRIVTRLEGQELIDKMRKKLRSKKGKEVYWRRKTIVEPVIGNMSYNMGFTEFLLRGLRKVKGEYILVAIGHNLKKITNYIREKFKVIRGVIINKGIVYNPSYLIKKLSFSFS